MSTPLSHMPSSMHVRRQRSPLKGRLLTLSLIAGITALIWFNRQALLRQAAEQWIVSDDIHPADAAIVLGGGIDSRPFAAAEDYRKGLTHKILVSNVPLNNVEVLGISPSHTALNCAVLIRLGVPQAAIETFGNDLSNAFEEAKALREWAVRSDARRIIVPIDIFFSRRARWILTRALDGTGTTVQIQAID